MRRGDPPRKLAVYELESCYLIIFDGLGIKPPYAANLKGRFSVGGDVLKEMYQNVSRPISGPEMKDIAEKVLKYHSEKREELQKDYERKINIVKSGEDTMVSLLKDL